MVRANYGVSKMHKVLKDKFARGILPNYKARSYRGQEQFMHLGTLRAYMAQLGIQTNHQRAAEQLTTAGYRKRHGELFGTGKYVYEAINGRQDGRRRAVGGIDRM